MQYAIIAAGEGSRLKSEGIESPKPLVQVDGEKLIDRLLRVFMQNGATDIVVICNEQMTDVAEHLKTLQRDGLNGMKLPLRFVVKDTPSSMHSFYELSEELSGKGEETLDKFILTTVDSIFDERRFAEYVRAFEASDADGMMAVTDYIEDEKPLYVQTDSADAITAFLDHDKEKSCQYISAGIYGLRPSAIGVLRKCMAEGKSRMRNFQRALIENGLHLKAFPLGMVFDIDHASDIVRANEVLGARKKSERHEVVGIYRACKYSPNKVDADKEILDAALRKLGREYIAVTEEEVVEGGLPDAVLYLSMARSGKVLDALRRADAKLLNSAEGIRKCCTRTWQETQTAGACPKWVKRADESAQKADDVVLCCTEEEYEKVTARFRQNNIPWVEQPHYEGDLVKFYAVSGTDFFHWSYPRETGQTKFGLEKENAELHRYAFEVKALQTAAEQIARRVGVKVYGGDAVVQRDGTVKIIDFNDWPSFAPCKDDAAAAIAAICKI